MSQTISAAERVWSIAPLRESILSAIPSENVPKIALVSQLSFEYMIRRKYRISEKKVIDRLFVTCKSRERKTIYRHAIRKLIFADGEKDVPHLARWPRLFKQFPCVDEIISEHDQVKRTIDKKGKSKLHLSYDLADTLPLDPKEPLKKRLGVPKSWEVTANIRSFVTTHNYEHIQSISEMQSIIKSNIVERFKMFGTVPSSFSVISTRLHSTCKMVYDIYRNLLEESLQLPPTLALIACDPTLPDLLYISRQYLEFLVIYIAPKVYNDVTVTFEDLYRTIKWNDLEKLTHLHLICKRQPVSHFTLESRGDGPEEIPTILQRRSDVNPLRSLCFFKLRLLYPPNTMLSPLQLQHERQYVCQVGKLLYHLTFNTLFSDIQSSICFIQSSMKNKSLPLEIEALYARDEFGSVKRAEFSKGLNKAFWTGILEKLSERLEVSLEKEASKKS
ncbi:uncharacterized protein L201_006132 [Kwoniella dendrophila CBS 6074]|uniref:Uncharacterized protein n=1 Tax=Kwoniella dendrophila CBS 6074 TaxID=1295534 RepID=A0AAX4K0V5_9TREE